jgi:serine phosphatase RsbU (regulator of sigma subunit)
MYVLAVVRRGAWIVLGVAAQFALIFAVDRLLPAGSTPGPGGPTLAAIRSQALFDAMGCLFAAVAGYVLFIGFISREGLRQVQLDTEIGLARDIHARLVPAFERRVSNFELLGRSVPSSEVGGDMVDVFETRDGLLGIVADVSGHGVTAGILMAMVRAAVRTSGATQATLEELFERIDRLLVDLDRPDKFATAACLRLHPDGTAEALLAGHLPILVVRAGARSVERIENGRPPLGIPVPSISTRTHRMGRLVRRH